MLRYVSLLVLIVQGTFNFADASYAETFQRCCDLGTKWAEEDLSCSTFPIPVAGISAADQALCLSSVEICCAKKHRETQCSAGQKAAKSGENCTPLISKPGSENFKDCCEACKMGLIIGSSGDACDPNTFGPPWDVSFLACCNEVLTTSLSISTTSSSTTTETTTVSPSRQTSELTSLSKTTSKNRLEPPSPPPLESLCDSLADELCAHICVPVPGSYRCECRRGFALMSDGKSCQQRDVSDRCKTNNPCQQQCLDTGVAVRCSCDRGYKLNPDKITCKDIDECEEGTHKCDLNQECINEPGSYDCTDVADNYSDEDEKCPLGYQYDTYSKICEDLDECKLLLYKCEKNETCKNTIGSYSCVSKNTDKFECPSGYYYKASIESCADIDECAKGLDDCNRESQVCLNLQGDFTCQNRASTITCPAGFKINMFGLCEDINECKELFEICSLREICINEDGGYKCILRTDNAQTDFPSEYITTTESKIPGKISENTYSSEPSLQRTYPLTDSTTPKPSLPGKSNNQTPLPYPNLYHPYQPPRNTGYYPDRNPPDIENCQQGFTYSITAQRCVDIDECSNEVNICDSNQDCQNTLGSFICVCKTGFQLDAITGACVDVNECQMDTHNCIHSQRCDNTVGSYQCVRFTNCGTGYTLNAASGLCEDDNECILGTHDCKLLGPQYECKNTLGSFRCERKRCITSNCYDIRTVYTIPATNVFSPIVDNTNKTPLTTIQLKHCLPGYIKNSMGHCDDINECTNSPCAKHQRCINTNGSYRCQNVINCTPGYKINDAGNGCEDIDECETGTHKCTGQQQCINREGFHICQCPPGHKANVANQCEDINECEYFRGQTICGRNAECENTIGSYRCRCKQGLQQTNGGNTCIDIDECVATPDLCEHTCVNVWGSYRCSCKSGYVLNSDNRTCTDLNECEMFKDKHLCIGFCENTPGSYTCRCPEGYRLGSDGRTCQDIDECERGNICPRPDDVCWNIRGSYRCNGIQCPDTYIRDPVQKNRCKRTTQFCNSRDLDCLRQPSSYSYNFITFVSLLPLPDEGQLDLFTMRGPQWDTTTTFNMEMVNVKCPYGINKVDKSYFRMRRSSVNAVVLSLVKVIEGPQDAELQLTMEVYQNGEYKGSVVAKVFVIISQYEF